MATPQFVSEATLEAALTTHWSAELASELKDFGILMLDEVRQRTETLDAKGLGLIGWSSALLAFLLVGENAQTIPWIRLLTVVPATLAMLSIAFATAATRLREWRWPSQHDWLRIDLFHEVETLQSYHLQCLLSAHTAHAQGNRGKARALNCAQGLLGAAAAATFVLIVARTAFS